MLNFYLIIWQSISEADVQKQYKPHQCKGKVTTQIHVPKQHEPELVHLISLALFGTLDISFFPNRNFVSSSYLWGRNQCSSPDIGEVDSINRVPQRSGTAVGHLPAAPVGSDLLLGLADWVPVLSIWPLGGDQYIAVPLYLASPRQEITLFHPTIWWCWIPCLFHFLWQKWNENLVFTLSIAILK